MKKQNADRKKNVAIGAAVVFGLMLIIGATFNLPASTQGLVTGRNVIVIEQLANQVGPTALVQASVDAGLLPLNSLDGSPQAELTSQRDRSRSQSQNERTTRNDRRQRRQERRAANRGDGRLEVNDEIIDRLERIAPETVAQAAVDAGLITNAEAERLLAQ